MPRNIHGEGQNYTEDPPEKKGNPAAIGNPAMGVTSKSGSPVQGSGSGKIHRATDQGHAPSTITNIQQSHPADATHRTSKMDSPLPHRETA